MRPVSRDAALDASNPLDELIPKIHDRQPRALARAVSLLERGGPSQRELVRRLFPHTGRARVVGVTGPPGAGKSTLVDQLARLCRERDETVAVLAVDPTSPYSGGALLGDRIRMQTLYTDPGVFIRSMATRGRLGGLARASHDAVDVLDAAGFDWVLVETVGVGQDEVDIVESSDTVVVVVVPGMGDDIQTLKAGLMEVADIFVVNKADRDGADRMHHELELMLGLVESEASEEGDAPSPNDLRRPEILDTVAVRGEGIGAVMDEIEHHRAWLLDTGALTRRRRAQLALRVRAILTERLLSAAGKAGLDGALDRAVREHTDPYEIADRIFHSIAKYE